MYDIYLLSPWCEIKYDSPQYSLNYIKYDLIDNGRHCQVIDCAFHDEQNVEIIKILKKNPKPIIGITGYTRERHHAYKLIRTLRKEIPDAYIICGGRHFGFLAEETLTNLPEVDIVVRGDGEITFREICDAIEAGRGYGDILGITFRKDDEIINTGRAPLINDVTQFRSYSRDELETYDSTLVNTKVDKKNAYFQVMTSRGCPFQCTFCSLGSQAVRYRDIDDVLDEVVEKMELRGSRYVNFTDSSFTINKKRVIKFCERIIERGIDVRWDCYSRVDIETDILKLMRKAGLVSVQIALESGSEKVLTAIKKKTNLDQFSQFLKDAHTLGIRSWVFTIVSSPEETLEDVDETLRLIEENAAYIHDFGMQATRILPDAALDRIARESGVLNKDFDWFADFNNPFSGEVKSDPFSERVEYGGDETIPLYLEHLTEDDIMRTLEKVRILRNKHFRYSDYFASRIRENLTLERLKEMSAKEMFGMAGRAFKMLPSIARNIQKERSYNQSANEN